MIGDGSLTARAEELVAWAAGLLATDGATRTTRLTIAEAVHRLGTDIGPADEIALGSLHGGSAAATTLARSPDGPVLMLARFAAEAPTPVHNHNSWGIVCVIRGRDRYLKWDRLDDGSDPDRARLSLAEEIVLGAGDLALLEEPPGDIHSQQGIEGPVWELVFFGRDPDARPRAYFRPESGVVTYASSGR